MSKLRLTFACGPYDRTLALRDGSVQPEGIELNYIASQPPDIFWRMLQFNEFEISEMSLSNYVTLVGAEKRRRGSRRRPISKASAAACPNTR